MAKIKDLLTQVEVRLALAQGLDVQIHAEERLIQTIRHKYEMLFDNYWWDEYLTPERFDINPTTNQIVGDFTNKVRRFQDVYSVFLNNETRPLPYLNKGVNPAAWRRPSILPTNDPVFMFKIIPSNTGDYINVWYRTILPVTVWTDGAYETDVRMDDQMLILGSVYDFLVDDGTNKEAAEKFKVLFDMRVAQQAGLQHVHGMPKSNDTSTIPSDWYYTNGP